MDTLDTSHDPSAEKSRDRLSEITLDTKSLGRANANIEHEREVAIFDIIDGNSFAVEGLDEGPYTLNLAAPQAIPHWRNTVCR